ncbi:glycosyltransferase family 4 protein [Candidatus Omnitrophota bacterium]
MGRTLLIASDYPPMVSGIARSLYNFWKYLPRSKMIIAAPRVKGCDEFDAEAEMPVFRYSTLLSYDIFSRSVNFISLFVFSLRLIGRYRIEKVVCGQPVSAGAIGLLLKKIFGTPYCVYVYGGERAKFRRFIGIIPLLKCIAANAEEVIANSNYTADEYRGYGIGSIKITVITPGVDTKVFTRPDDADSLKAELGLSGKRVLFTAARLSERKGHDLTILAMPEVIKEVPDCVYVIAGDGPRMGRLKGMVRELRLEGRVIFTGFLNDERLTDYYKACDLFVMVNRETKGVETVEGFGTSFIEASACGKPVIGGRSGGVEDAVVDNETGILVDPLNKDDISGAIIRILKDDVLAKRLGDNGRRRVERSFGWRTLSKKVEEVLFP